MEQKKYKYQKQIDELIALGGKPVMVILISTNTKGAI